ncbi:DUF1292 domain-containing protein [Kurthia huakuii]|uniref:DUF1292 domain-containing protein n=1 Tax=Kurthia huakuii TaxID=1421019 RepID=UPI000496BC4D|nr:DUF1292 domain-containing protein [Kurthia huakuii]MBM7697927.1 uncharacterized protein YrzB (UPF0473 family) [Kurthia huakuii]
MAEHNHEHLVAVDENGNEIVFAVIERFEANGKDFILFAEEKEGGSEVQAAVIVVDADGNEDLQPVESSEDQAVVAEVLERLSNGVDEENAEHIVAVDDNGNEITFVVIARFTVEDKTYVAFVEEEVENPELQVAIIRENEAGEQGLAPIESDEEFEKVQEILTEILSGHED